MSNIGPCMCGDTECPSCGPLQGYPRRKHYPLGSLSAEDIDILNEQAAADEEAELVYQQRQDDARQRAEAWYAAEQAEAAYRRMLEDEDDSPTVEHDIFETPNTGPHAGPPRRRRCTH